MSREIHDAEGRVSTVSTLNGANVATYVYDAEGRRVRKITASGSEDDIYDLSGHVISAFSTASPVSWLRGEVYAGGAHLATYMNGTTYFVHADWLGTERARSTVSGGPYQGSQWTSYPFGEGSSALNPDPTHFTGKDHDTESGLDYFYARYYSETLGRFMTPDWAAAPAAVPYANYGDPQSLNLYAYVENSPVTGIDADGHCGQSWNDCALEQEVGFNQFQYMQELQGEADEGGYEGAESNNLDYPDSPCDPMGNGCTFTPYDRGPFPVMGVSDGWAVFGGEVPGPVMSVVPGYIPATGKTVDFPDTYSVCGDFICDPNGHEVAVVQGGGAARPGFIVPLLAGAAAYAVADAATVEAGTLFGTRYLGNRPLLNSADELRIGWSRIGETGKYVFRIGGDWIEQIKDNPHINLWPPSWWGK